MIQLKYHRETYNLLNLKPKLSVQKQKELNITERKLAIKFPAAFREWFSLEDCFQILEDYSLAWPIEISNFGKEIEDLNYGGFNQSFLKKPVLPFLIEDQGTCYWAIIIDGSDDPPTITVSSSSKKEWREGPLFSTFIYIRIWDWFPLVNTPSVRGLGFPLNNDILKDLQYKFKEEYRTEERWYGNYVFYRFSNRNQRILLHESESSKNKQCLLFLYGKTSNSLIELLSILYKDIKLLKLIESYEGIEKREIPRNIEVI